MTLLMSHFKAFRKDLEGSPIKIRNIIINIRFHFNYKHFGPIVFQKFTWKGWKNLAINNKAKSTIFQF